MTTAFCKFRISKDLGIVEIDSDESAIRKYLQMLVSEFENGNAKLISATMFNEDDNSDTAELNDSQNESTFVQVMVSLKDDEIGDLTNSEMVITQKALEVLKSDNLQITHSEKRGSTSYIGFSQL